jgi:hypothetical protein
MTSENYLLPSSTYRAVFASPDFRARSLISDDVGGFRLAREDDACGAAKIGRTSVSAFECAACIGSRQITEYCLSQCKNVPLLVARASIQSLNIPLMKLIFGRFDMAAPISFVLSFVAAHLHLQDVFSFLNRNEKCLEDIPGRVWVDDSVLSSLSVSEMIAKDEMWLSGVVVVDKADYPEKINVVGEVVLKSGVRISIRSLFVVGNWEGIGSNGTYCEGFGNCCRLRSVILPSSLVTISKYCFCGCSSLCRIEIPDTLKVIGDDAFRASGLVEIDLPDEMYSIGSEAFFACPNLRRIRLPRKLGLSGDSMLDYAPLLVDVEVPIELGWAGACILDRLQRLTVWNISSCSEYAFAHCSVGELIFRGDDIRVLESSKWKSVKRIRSTRFAGRVVLGLVVESE